ncbi:MAG: POLIIIAc domain-containing protein [Thermoanaerobacterium thermosaccharolyticum]|jgi:predicted metal-dependent phosphoesterase TrpH
MYLYQFHVHTEYSPDCDVKLNKLYKRLKNKGISGVAITDHNTIEGAIKFKKLYENKIDIIVGEEIMTSKGEIIGLFLKSEIPKGLTPRKTIKLIKLQHGIVYIPHPCDMKRKKTCLNQDEIINNIKDIDMIEIFNGRCIRSEFNDNAYELSKKLNKKCIYGSDSHSIYELKYNLVAFRNKLNKNNIIDELNYCEPMYKKTNRKIHYYTIFIKIKKMLRKGKYNEAMHFIFRGCKKRLYRAFKINR